jgi:hypothetical protein
MCTVQQVDVDVDTDADDGTNINGMLMKKVTYE